MLVGPVFLLSIYKKVIMCVVGDVQYLLFEFGILKAQVGKKTKNLKNTFEAVDDLV